MWVCVNDGFVSVVEDWNDTAKLVVRARRHRDLANFLNDNSIRIEYTPNNDYRYRASITREQYADMLVAAAKKIDYTNFKASVVNDDLSRFYAEVWYAGLKNLDPDWWIRQMPTNTPLE